MLDTADSELVGKKQRAKQNEIYIGTALHSVSKCRGRC